MINAKKYLIGILLFSGLLACGIMVAFRVGIYKDKDFDYNSDWSTEAFYNAFPSEIESVEVFLSVSDNGKEQSYVQLKQMHVFLKLNNQADIAKFLFALRYRDDHAGLLENHGELSMSMERPDKVYHIVIWKKNHDMSGYGQVLVFRTNGQEIGFVKACDGTGAYRYNKTIVEYLEKMGRPK